MVKPQHKPHQHQDFLDHYHNHWEWGGQTTLPMVPAVGFGRPPWSIGLNDSQDKLMSWMTSQFNALTAGYPLIPIPRLSQSSPAYLHDNYSLMWAPNGARNHSILI
jgi:hypothetical protein